MAKKGLGRGLGAIFGEEVAVQPQSIQKKTKKEAATEKIKDDKENVSRETNLIKISLIEPNASQPRKIFNEESLKELADSIQEHGVLQPILVKKKGRMYEIVVGERRWRASKMAGLKEIPAIIKDMDSKEAAEAALIENIQREDLGSVEEARAYKALIDEYDLTQEELAKRVSKSRTAVTNSMRLLQLDDEVLDLIESGELSAGHARAILGINGKRNQYKAAREVVNNGLSVRQTEKLVKTYNRQTNETSKKHEKTEEEKKREIFISAVETELTEIMNTRVSIKQNGVERGKIEIEYYSDDELNRIIDKFR